MKLIAVLLVNGALGFGADDARELNVRGQRLLERGLVVEAVRVFARAEIAARKEFGTESLPAAMIGRNHALALVGAGDLVQAGVVAGRALATVERLAGAGDAQVVPILNTLAEIAIAERRYDDAETHLCRAVAIGAAAGAHFATAIHNLGAVAERRGLVDEARALYEKALSIRQRELGEGHVATMASSVAVRRMQGSLTASSY